MKQPGLFILLLSFSLLINLEPAAAQDLFHCDSLKVTCSDDAKIKVRYFKTAKTCPATCNFCAAIAKQDWLLVEKQLKTEIKTLPGTPETFPVLQSRLLAHRLVNFVLPPKPETLQTPETELQIGFQVPHMTYAWNAAFQLKKGRKTKPAYWKLSNFMSDTHIFSRLNSLADNFQQFLKSDSLNSPPPLLPDQNYLAAWFGTRQVTPTEKARLEMFIKTQPREAVKYFTDKKDGVGLALLMAHQNLAVRYLALQGIRTIQDKSCLPYLLRLAETTMQPTQTYPETGALYTNFCEQLVATISILTNCNFNRCPFAHYPPQHYLRLGLPAWEIKIDSFDPQNQGIGSYVMEIHTN